MHSLYCIFLYIRERFPVAAAGAFAAGYTALVIGAARAENPWVTDTGETIRTFFLLSCVFFFFLLRQRVVDEFRDVAHDRQYFPNRPVPRGLITMTQLTMLGIAAGILELASASVVGAFPTYWLVIIYSCIMAKDFFLHSWLRRHFTVDFLIHEVIFVFFGIAFLFAAEPSMIGQPERLFLSLIILLLAPMQVEIIRKFKPRHDPSGHAVADTYTTVWGRPATMTTLILLSAGIATGLMMLKSSLLFVLWSLLFVTGLRWKGNRSDTVVIVIGVAHFIGCALLANLVW